jgi:hypothetical protein
VAGKVGGTPFGKIVPAAFIHSFRARSCGGAPYIADQQEGNHYKGLLKKSLTAFVLRHGRGIFTAPFQGAMICVAGPVGCRPRLIYDAAAKGEESRSNLHSRLAVFCTYTQPNSARTIAKCAILYKSQLKGVVGNTASRAMFGTRIRWLIKRSILCKVSGRPRHYPDRVY